MNVLLIGGTGILSSAVTMEALCRGLNVTMINRGTRIIPDNVELIVSDYQEYHHIGNVLKGRRFDAVIDFLCYTPTALEASFKLYSHFTTQYFFISTCAVYDTTTPGPYDEESPKVTAIWPYSVNKWNCEQLLKTLALSSNCQYTIIRPCLTYDDTRIPYGVMPEFRKHWTFIARILAGKPIVKWNNGENRWNIMRVEDFAVGLVGLIGNEAAYGEAFNICGDETPSNNDILNVISGILMREIRSIDIPVDFYAGEMPAITGEIIGGRAANLVCKNDKIKKLIPEFKQNINLHDGVAMTIEGYVKKNYQHGIDWSYDGKTDYIIKKWCHKTKKYCADMNLRFIDYIGTGDDAASRLIYRNEVNKDSIGRKMIAFCRRVKKRISSILK